MISPCCMPRRYLRSFGSGAACRWFRAIPIVLIISYCLFYKWKRIVPESWYFVNRLQQSTLPSHPLWRTLEKEVNGTKIHFPVDADVISGCKLSILDPWNPDILPYVKDVPSIHCPSDQRSILYTQDNRLLVNSTALTEDGKVRNEVVCTYRYVVSSDNLDTYGFSEEMTLQGEEVELDERYVSVSVRCLQDHWLTSFTPQIVWRISGLEFFRNILFYIPRPVSTSNAATATSHSSERYSVFIFIIDGMSQMNYFRSLPKTAHLLTNYGSNLFSGYHRVGRNSYPNVMALLSGETGGNNCWLTQDSCDEKEKSKMYYIDIERQTILPTLYRSHNYKTMLLEDSQLVSTFHRPGRIGFKQAPTQMYFRSSYLAMENDGHHLNTQIGEHSGGFACLHNQLMHKHQFRLMEDFMETYKNEDYFAHIHLASYLHNNLNMAKLYDEDLFLLLKSAISKGNLKKTFFLLMGDHGFQRGEEAFTLTSQGRAENNLPLLTILPPPGFVSRHPDLAMNLAANRDKLTSHFDTNQFLRDILALGLNQSRSQLFQGYSGHGSSLLSPLESRRSCRAASIPADYCTCQEATKHLQTNSSDVMSMGFAVVSDLNAMLSSVPVCKPLVLHEVHSASVREAGSGDVTVTSLFSVHLLVEMVEQVMLEVVVEVEGRKLGKVRTTRLDWYTEKSSCLPSALEHLRPFCICY